MEGIVAGAVGIAALIGGIALARSSKRASTIDCAVVLLVVSVKAAVWRRPDIEFNFFPWIGYAVVEPFWPYVLGAHVIGIGLWVARASLLRRCVMYAGLAALATPLGLDVWGALSVDPNSFRGVPDADGVCLQSTGYTCAPAAAASFLKARGIETSEREMAILCRTNALFGTSEFGIAAGLTRKGLRPRIGMGVLPAPCLAVVKFSNSINHCVMVTGVEAEKIQLIDPLEGRVTEDRRAFERRWLGTAIWADP